MGTVCFEFRHASPLTKSFTSTGIGLAVQEGRLSLDDQVISFFPDDQPSDVSENLGYAHKALVDNVYRTLK